MSEALKDYLDVVVVNSQKTALALSLDLKNLPQEKQRAAFAGERSSGYFYLHSMDAHPGDVMECVVSLEGDAITSVYKGHRIFNSVGELVRARTDLVNAIAEKVGLSVGAIGIEDQSRGRALGLSELATGQLIDLLADRVGKSIVVTDSHSTAGAGGVVIPG